MGISEIAIIGTGGVFPGADDPDSFWDNLVSGATSITRFDPPADAAPHYVPSRGMIPAPYAFDRRAFGFSEGEARLLDPQARHFLQACLHAVEDAGVPVDRLDADVVGVFAGCSLSSYRLAAAFGPDGFTGSAERIADLVNNDRDFLATRAAYTFGFTGPAVSIQTACSTSLVAVCQAATSLSAYECDYALAGGVGITLPQETGHYFEEGGVRSRDGSVAPFSTAADGFVRGNGCAVVLLARLEDAVAAGLPVHAVIAGWSVNNDGRDRVGFLAPSVRGQQSAVETALQVAGIEPADLSFVETHGTATEVGDAIELEALARALPLGTRTGQPKIFLGAVKANIGHLDSAAGCAGLIKAARAVETGTLPPQPLPAGAEPIPELDSAGFALPLQVERLRPGRDGAFWGGVSSFGLGGTNAHVVVRSAGPTARTERTGPAAVELVLASATTEASLAATTGRYRRAWNGLDPAGRSDLSHVSRTGRAGRTYRSVGVARTDQAELSWTEPSRAVDEASVGFLLPGAGRHRPGELAAVCAVAAGVRKEVDGLLSLVPPDRRAPVRAYLLNPDATGPVLPSIELPALFISSVALAALLRERGVTPRVVLGHSAGEFAAATIAGAMPAAEAMEILCFRARGMEGAPPGGSRVVAAPAEEVARLFPHLDIAADNSPVQCVISGSRESLRAAEADLAGAGIPVKDGIDLEIAPHSRLMETLAEDLARMYPVGPTPRPAPVYLSSVSGRPYRADPGSYWASHTRETVRFRQGLLSIADLGCAALVQLGAGSGLLRLAQQTLGEQAPLCVPLPGDTGVLGALGELWKLGVDVDWGPAVAGTGSRLPRTSPDAEEYALPLLRLGGERLSVPGGTAAPDTRSSANGAGPPALELAPDGSDRGGPAADPDGAADLRTVQQLFGQAVGRERLDPEEDFFRAGGDSLAAVGLVTRIRKHFGVRFPLKHFLVEPTPAAVGRRLSLAQARAAAATTEGDGAGRGA